MEVDKRECKKLQLNSIFFKITNLKKSARDDKKEYIRENRYRGQKNTEKKKGSKQHFYNHKII